MKKKLTSLLYYVLMLVLACVFCFSGWMIYQESKQSKEEDAVYEELNQYIEVSDEVNSEIQQEKIHIPNVDFEGLREINDDLIGWIYIEDTNVSYPVVQTDNNDYYLRHLFNKKYGISGSVFMDSRTNADMTSRHTIFYAHHMKKGTMFADVEKFEDQSFADEHPTGLFITPDKVYEITFFAGYLTEAVNDCWIVDFDSDEEYEEWISNAISRSNFKTDIIPTVQDQIVTLSTCSYDIADGRFVLLGIVKKIDE